MVWSFLGGASPLGLLDSQLFGFLDLHDVAVMHDDLNDAKAKRPDLAFHDSQPGWLCLFCFGWRIHNGLTLKSCRIVD